jgi:hypothetical protein
VEGGGHEHCARPDFSDHQREREREREREKRERGTQPAWLTKKNERIRRTEIGVQMKKVRLKITEKNNGDGTA